jgi:CRISPR-associated protein Csm5
MASTNKPIHTHFDVTVETLSPVHIGSGAELLLHYDVISRQGKTYRVDEETLLDAALSAAEQAGPTDVQRVLSGAKPDELLAASDYRDDSPLFRYVLPGMPTATTPGAAVREQIKDSFDRPYLPGSTLKGGLRTVLARALWDQAKMTLDLNSLGRNRSWASQSLERRLFGADPNHDLLRALRVSDSEPLGRGQNLVVGSVQVYPTASATTGGLNLDMEMVDKGAVFRTAITVDEYLFQTEPLKVLGWKAEDRLWLNQIPALARQQMTANLQADQAFFSKKGAAYAASACGQWLTLLGSLAGNEFLLPLGFGTGWESKTLGAERLGQGGQGFEMLINQYRMTKERLRKPGDPFPKSRHLFMRGKDPGEPIGWVKVRMEPASSACTDWQVAPPPSLVGPVTLSPTPTGGSAAKSKATPDLAGWQAGIVESYEPRKRKGMVAPEGGPFKLPFDGSVIEDQSWTPTAGAKVLFQAVGFAVTALRKG